MVARSLANSVTEGDALNASSQLFVQDAIHSRANFANEFTIPVMICQREAQTPKSSTRNTMLVGFVLDDAGTGSGEQGRRRRQRRRRTATSGSAIEWQYAGEQYDYTVSMMNQTPSSDRNSFMNMPNARKRLRSTVSYDFSNSSLPTLAIIHTRIPVVFFQ